jgi:hypothetical protein
MREGGLFGQLCADFRRLAPDPAEEKARGGQAIVAFVANIGTDFWPEHHNYCMQGGDAIMIVKVRQLDA